MLRYQSLYLQYHRIYQLVYLPSTHPHLSSGFCIFPPLLLHLFLPSFLWSLFLFTLDSFLSCLFLSLSLSLIFFLLSSFLPSFLFACVSLLHSFAFSFFISFLSFCLPLLFSLLSFCLSWLHTGLQRFRWSKHDMNWGTPYPPGGDGNLTKEVRRCVWQCRIGYVTVTGIVEVIFDIWILFHADLVGTSDPYFFWNGLLIQIQWCQCSETDFTSSTCSILLNLPNDFWWFDNVWNLNGSPFTDLAWRSDG